MKKFICSLLFLLCSYVGIGYTADPDILIFTQEPNIPTTLSEGNNGIELRYIIKNQLEKTSLPIKVNLLPNDDDRVFLFNDCGASLGPQQSCSIFVEIFPSSLGPIEQTLSIDYNSRSGPLTSEIETTVIAALSAFLEFTVLPDIPSEITFGSSTADLTYAIKNFGTADATQFLPSITGDTPDIITLIANTCGTTLMVGDTCTLTYRIENAAPLGQSNNQLSITYQGTPSPLITKIDFAVVRPTTGAFLEFTMLPAIPSEVKAGDTVNNLQYTIQNTGNVQATGITPSIIGNTPGIIIQTNNACGATLNAGASCTLTYSIQNATPIGQTTNQLSIAYMGGPGIPLKSDFNFKIISASDPSLLYISDFANDPGTVFKCNIDSVTGHLSCADSGATHLGVPAGIVFAIIQGTEYAYITNYFGEVTQCTIAMGGNLNCANPAVSLPALPNGIAFFTTLTNITYAYIADYTSHNILKCNVSAAGVLSACNPVVALGFSPGLMTLQSFNGTTYLYFGNESSNSTLYRCAVNSSTGSLNCGATGDYPANTFSTQVGFATVGGNQYGYVTLDTATTHVIYQCNVDNLGKLSGCVITGNGFTDPRGIVYATINGTRYMYIADLGGTVQQCTIGVGGALTCNNSMATGIQQPYGIALPL